LGTAGPAEGDEKTGNDPLLVWREVQSSEKERVPTMAPTSNVCSTAPDPASHSLTVLSLDADASSLPSGEKATAVTQSEWPSSVCSTAPDPASHSLTALSRDADASSLLSGEKATALIQLEWPSSVCSTAPEPASHSLIVLSYDADASHRDWAPTELLVFPVDGNVMCPDFNIQRAISNRPATDFPMKFHFVTNEPIEPDKIL
jgi:hypothetical protein